jgi:phospholipase/carboxylesterase
MTVDAYIAATARGEPGRPLVLAFHGTGGNEAQFFGLAGQLVPGAAVVAPRGDVSEHGAARFFRRMGEGRYDMADLAARTDKMAGFIAAQKAAHPGRPVYGFGYSNGANILASVAMARPDLFDRVALLHPLIPWQAAPVTGLAGKHVLITAGRHDSICPWTLTERLVDWFAGQGAQVETEFHEGGHEIRPTEIDALAQFFATA